MSTNVHRFKCPHCGGLIEVEKNQVNCGIFRHGLVKATRRQLNPHASQRKCKEQAVYGCGKPFRFSPLGGAQKCGYI